MRNRRGLVTLALLAVVWLTGPCNVVPAFADPPVTGESYDTGNYGQWRDNQRIKNWLKAIYLIIEQQWLAPPGSTAGARLEQGTGGGAGKATLSVGGQPDTVTAPANTYITEMNWYWSGDVDIFVEILEDSRTNAARDTIPIFARMIDKERFRDGKRFIFHQPSAGSAVLYRWAGLADSL